MDIQETRFFQTTPLAAAAPTAGAYTAAPAAADGAPEEAVERRCTDRRVDDQPVAVDQRVADRRSADVAANALTAQGGLALTPSPAQAAISSIGSGAAEAPSLFIDAELRPQGGSAASEAKSLAELNVAAPMSRPGEPSKGFEKGSEKGREKGEEKGFEKGREKGSEKGEEKGREKGEEKGREKGEEKGREKGEEKGREKGEEKGREKGEEKGSEKGREKGSEKNHEKGSEKDHEKGSEKNHEKGSEKDHEKSSEKQHEKGSEKDHEKGGEKQHEKSGEKQHEKGGEKQHEKGHEKGAEKPGEHPQGPHPPPSRPPHQGAPPPPARPPVPKAPPTHTVHDGGHDFKIPQGGWVTQAQRQHPDTKTGVIDRKHDWRNQITDVRHWHDGDMGSDWYQGDHGFYNGDSFWFGFDLGQTDSWDYDTDPVYVMSPVTGDDCGVLTPPDGGFGDDPNAVYEQVLDMMSNPAQDPNDPNYDKTAGLYLGTDNFDPTNPGQQLSGQDAWSALSNGQPLYFHPPNGDWEAISGVDDLNAYLYTQEQQQQSTDPTQPTDPNQLPLLDPSKGTLKAGDGMGDDGPSDDVKTLQARLNAAGFNVGEPDGEFGPATQAALQQFQAAQGLSADGIAGPTTMAALNQIGQ